MIDQLTIEQAVDQLARLLILTGPKAPWPRGDYPADVPRELVDDELFQLRLFAFMFCLKFSRYPTWDRRGLEVFDGLFKNIFKRLYQHDSAMALEVVDHRMKVYGNAINETGDLDNIPATTSRIAITFSSICSQRADLSLVALAEAEFINMFHLLSDYQMHNLLVLETT